MIRSYQPSSSYKMGLQSSLFSRCKIGIQILFTWHWMKVWVKWTQGRTCSPLFFILRGKLWFVPPPLSTFWHWFSFFQHAKFRSCVIGKTLSKKQICTNFYVEVLKMCESSPPPLRDKIAPMVPRPPPFPKMLDPPLPGGPKPLGAPTSGHDKQNSRTLGI